MEPFNPYVDSDNQREILKIWLTPNMISASLVAALLAW